MTHVTKLLRPLENREYFLLFVEDVVCKLTCQITRLESKLQQYQQHQQPAEDRDARAGEKGSRSASPSY